MLCLNADKIFLIPEHRCSFHVCDNKFSNKILHDYSFWQHFKRKSHFCLHEHQFFFFKFWKMEKILINMETANQSQGFKLIRFIFFYFLIRVSFLYFDRRLKRQSKPSMYHFGFQELIRFLYMALNLLSW